MQPSNTESLADSFESNVDSELNKVKNPDDIKFDNSIDLVETKISPQIFRHLEGLWLKFEPRINRYISINVKNAAENVLKEVFPNEKNIDMDKIFNLSDLEKSQLASKLVSIEQIPEKTIYSRFSYFNESSWEREVSPFTCIEIQNLLDKWEKVGSEELPFDLVSEFGGILRASKHQLKLDLFTSFYKSWAQVSPMPNTYSVATWDLSSTTWIWWESNLWRWEWLYSKEKNKQTNYIDFWPLSRPMEIFVGAEWIDIDKNGVGWWKIEFVFEKNWKESYIKWEYTSEWLKLIKDYNLKDVDLSGNKIVIPKTYSGWNISVNTESVKYDESNYDEVNFDLYMENW
jgi:hypothetical protein